MLRSLPTKTERNTLFKVYGVLLNEILDYYQIPNPRSKIKIKLHNAFKSGIEIESIKKLSNDQLSGYIELIQRYFAVELGIYLRSTNEPKNVSDLTLSQYLKIMNDKTTFIREALDKEYNLDSYRARKRFLVDLIGAPAHVNADNDDILLNGIKFWLNNN